jgi:hypothetical protein
MFSVSIRHQLAAFTKLADGQEKLYFASVMAMKWSRIGMHDTFLLGR